MIKPIAPTHSVLRSITQGQPVTISKFLSGHKNDSVFVSEDEANDDVSYRTHDGNDGERLHESPFSIAPQPAKFDRYNHLAELHKYGRKPHAEAIAGLIDNFYVDGNVSHLNEAENLIKHLKDLP